MICKSIPTAAVMMIGLTAAGSQAANITYLNHFNNASSFDADYGAAPAVTTTTGTPEAGDGFTGFGAGNGGVTLDYLTDWIQWAAVSNVTPTNGLSMGFWVKQSHDAAANGTTYYRFAGIGRDDFPPGNDSVHAAFGNGSAYIAEVEGADRENYGTSNGFYRAQAGGWLYLVPDEWWYYNIDVKLPEAGIPNSGHYRVRVYDADGNLKIGGGALPVAGEKLLSPGQQDAFNILADTTITIGAGAAFGGGPARTMTIDELAIWDSSLTVDEVDAIAASMAAGNELAVPEPGVISMFLLGSATMLGRKRRNNR